ncbi:MAG: domain containing protein, partial [Pedobacter sp.]|nr:domain containing protein [Pedobacter sp.]
MRFKGTLIFLCLFFLITSAKSQNVSNEGFDFWAVFPTHVPNQRNYAQMSIYITSKNASSGTISVGTASYPFSVGANQIIEIPIDYGQAYINDTEAGSVINNKSIHIVVSPGQQKVACFAFISASARSEAYLVLPTSAMGQDYYAFSAEGIGADRGLLDIMDGKHYIIIVATEANTTVNIRKKDNTQLQVVLPKVGDMYELLDNRDISGTEIKTLACKKVAVFSGHSGIAFNFAHPTTSYDPLIQQLYPIESWGKVYGIIPFKDRNYFYKVIAAETNTHVSINGTEVAVLNAGETFIPATLPLVAPLMLTSDHPVSVAQFAYSESDLSSDPKSDLLGDPDMVILNPEEYNIKQITLFASFNRTTEFYLNVFMRTSAVSTFQINGSKPAGIWRPMTSNPEYSYQQVSFSSSSLSQPSLTLTADEGFNAVAYGFGEFESYAYSAGTNLAVNNALKLTNVNAGVTAEDACINEPLSIKVVLPNPVTSLNWKFEDPSQDFLDSNPQGTVVTNADGTTSYEYIYPKGNVLFSSLGLHQIRVEAVIVPGLNPCADLNGTITYAYDFEIQTTQITVPEVVEILKGGTARIGATSNNSKLTYQWSPASGLSDPKILDPDVSVENTTLYTLTATSELGCVVSKNVLVKVSDSFNVPNTFSPNGDGVNDVWNLRLLDTYRDSQVEIFSRYGQKVFS